MNQRIGIYGGTFNPIHLGHLIVAEDVLIQKQLDKIIFVPNAHPPHKEATYLLPPEQRFEMVKLALDDNDFFELSDIEMVKDGYSYTSNTMSYFATRFPGDTLFFIIGADSLFEIHLWKNIEQLISHFSFIIARRRGSSLTAENINRIPLSANLKGKLMEGVVHTPFIEISGTMIRNRRTEGKSIRYLVPDRVRRYIINNKLFEKGGPDHRPAYDCPKIS